jgi:hypothetical protein
MANSSYWDSSQCFDHDSSSSFSIQSELSAIVARRRSSVDKSTSSPLKTSTFSIELVADYLEKLSEQKVELQNLLETNSKIVNFILQFLL